MILYSLQKLLLKTNVKGAYGSIRIVDMGGSGPSSAAFITFTIQALQLIEKVDSRRFGYIQREIRYIANTPLLTGASYTRELLRCSVDIDRYACTPDTPEYEWYLASYACTLVHEATHGRVYHYGISYDEHTYLRIERLCHQEATRFSQRLNSRHYDFDRLVGKFDAGRYENYWSQRKVISRFEYLKQMLARMCETVSRHNR